MFRMTPDYAQRRQRLSARIAMEGLDAFLVTDLSNVAYLTGFGGDSSYLIVTPNTAKFLSDARYEEQFADECPGLDTYFRRPGETQLQSTCRRLNELRCTKVAFEPASLSVANFEGMLKEAPSVKWTGVVGWVEDFRAIKDATEIAALNESIRIAEEAYRIVLNSFWSGDTEKEVADRLEFTMRDLGATVAAFPTIIAAGRTAALPHCIPSARKLGGEELLLIDWG